jgi:hypothetical protein
MVELSKAAMYRRLALAGRINNVTGKRDYASLGRVAIDLARAIRQQVPHGYPWAVGYRYEPAELGAVGRRMVVYIENVEAKLEEMAA